MFSQEPVPDSAVPAAWVPYRCHVDGSFPGDELGDGVGDLLWVLAELPTTTRGVGGLDFVFVYVYVPFGLVVRADAVVEFTRRGACGRASRSGKGGGVGATRCSGARTASVVGTVWRRTSWS